MIGSFKNVSHYTQKQERPVKNTFTYGHLREELLECLNKLSGDISYKIFTRREGLDTVVVNAKLFREGQLTCELSIRKGTFLFFARPYEYTIEDKNSTIRYATHHESVAALRKIINQGRGKGKETEHDNQGIDREMLHPPH